MTLMDIGKDIDRYHDEVHAYYGLPAPLVHLAPKGKDPVTVENMAKGKPERRWLGMPPDVAYVVGSVAGILVLYYILKKVA